MLLPLALFMDRNERAIRWRRFLVGFVTVGLDGSVPLIASGTGAIRGWLRYATAWRTNASVFPLAAAGPTTRIQKPRIDTRACKGGRQPHGPRNGWIGPGPIFAP